MTRSKRSGLPDNHTQLAYRGVILLGVDRPREALQLFDDAARAFAAQKMAIDELQMHILAADALLQLGSPRDARARLDPRWPAIEEQIGAGNASMTKGLRVRARLLHAEGRLADARATIRRAVDLVTASNAPTYTGAAAIYQTSAALALAAGDHSAALDDVERALERAGRDAIDPQASADLGELLLLRARIQDARGRADAAARDAFAAASHLRATLPREHSAVREAVAAVSSVR
jgi:tetratricopeptide (TPR) repeat protein